MRTSACAKHHRTEGSHQEDTRSRNRDPRDLNHAGARAVDPGIQRPIAAAVRPVNPGRDLFSGSAARSARTRTSARPDDTDHSTSSVPDDRPELEGTPTLTIESITSLCPGASVRMKARDADCSTRSAATAR